MEKFVVKLKKNNEKDDESIIMSLRINKKLQEEYDELANKSNRSRNELMCMALRYALDNLDFLSKYACIKI